MEVSDRIRFNNHDRVGMLTAQRILKRFHTSNSLIEGVGACIAHHMHFMHVQKMKLGTLKKFLSRPTIETELELHRIDCIASHENCDNYHFLKQQLRNFNQELLKPDPLLRGQDLIKLGFKPGPLFGEILSTIDELQLEEEISTHDEAVKMVLARYQIG